MMEGSRGQPKSFPLRLPRALWAMATELARRDGVSLNQFIVQAIAEKITRLECSPSSTGFQQKPGPG